MSGSSIIHNSQQTNNRISNLFSVQSLLWLALILALAGSLRHLASMFASVDGNIFYGYLSAIAVDAGLFSLSYSLKKRKADKRGTKVLWLGIVLFTGISVYGNLSYGIVAMGDTLPYLLSVIRPIVLAASLPVLVLYLAELVSDDRQHAIKEAEKEEKKRQKSMTNNLSVTDSMSPIDKARQAKNDKVTERRQSVLSLLQAGMSEDDMASQLGVSTRTIQRDISSLNGKVMTK